MGFVSADFQALLKLQEVDTTVDQLLHKREHLPAHDVVKAVQADAMKLRPQIDEVTKARNELLKRQDEIDANVVATKKRIDEINNRLYDGSAKIAPNDALAMSQEVRHLKERQTQLEDSELEVMELLEPAEAAVLPLEREAQALATKMQQANHDIAQTQAQIDAELLGLRDIRAKLLGPIPEALVAEYEKLRKRLGGVAVAPLVGNTCGGCHISMSSTELESIRKAPEGALVHCEECDRLLVRS